jgi:LysM repeat protein
MLLRTSFMFAGNSENFTFHTVEKGETLYSISHHYGLKPQDIAQYNDAVGEKLTIHVGQKLKVPATAINKDAERTENTKTESVSSESVSTDAADGYHIVKKGETIFSISKKYEVSRTDLMVWNHIKDNGIEIGQKLMVRNSGSTSANVERVSMPVHTESFQKSATPSVSKTDVEAAMKKEGYTWTLPNEGKEAKAQEVRDSKTNVSTASPDVTASAVGGGGVVDTRIIKTWKSESASDRSENMKVKTAYDPATDYESLYYQNVYSGMAKKSETGIAKFLVDNNNANIAYYNNAGIGTILKLTNPGNGKTTYAIVVGKVPQTEENSFLLKLSGKVAKNLNAKDYTSIEVVFYSGN